MSLCVFFQVCKEELIARLFLMYFNPQKKKKMWQLAKVCKGSLYLLEKVMNK